VVALNEGSGEFFIAGHETRDFQVANDAAHRRAAMPLIKRVQDAQIATEN
jgi:hypothetical protein